MAKVINGGLDALKIALSCMVAVGHSGLFGGSVSLLGYQVNSGLFRITVPVFFLISGYYIYHSLQRDPNSLKIWVRRATTLYVFWMIIYLPFYITTDTFDGLKGLLTFIKYWIVGFFHLWYVISMIGGGILIYILRNQSNRTLIYLTVLLYLTGAFLQYIRAYYEIPVSLLQHINANDYVGRNFLFVAFPLMTIGFLIARNRLEEKITTGKILFLLIFGCATVLGEATLNYYLQQDSVRRLSFDCMLSIIIAAPALFLLPLRHVIAGRSLIPAKVSAAIYYIHPFILLTLMGLGREESTSTAMIVLLLSLPASALLILASRRWRFIL
ncbi:acyltransferase family protein [Pseudomonas sp. Marseille-Q8238]